MDEKKRTEKVISVCLEAGKIMVQSGSEMYRVEDTMTRMAQAAGVQKVNVFGTPTAIAMGVDDVSGIQLKQIKSRTINLEKVSRVNELSRKFSAGTITLEELAIKLKFIDEDVLDFPFWLQAVSAAMVGSTLMILFIKQYDWIDFPISAFLGMLGFILFTWINKKIKLKFMSEFFASIIIGFLTIGAVKLGLGKNIDNILIGAVMPLVPGVPLTNSLRDLLEAHLLAGIARGVEAVLSALAIGIGIAVVLKMFL
ncbi:threonine/serine exporter family protein [Companilactobacillus sp. DQM5]|uniref:threonine/serine exporter family protein n=1 Tax=Companilactobacillus sp. DQM5 TaxID=3463359 RepID=UPI0040585352